MFIKWLGYGLLISVIIHMLLWWSVYAENNSFPSDLYSIPTAFHKDNFTIPLATTITVFMVVFMGIFTFHSIRRWNYDFFYITHHFFMIIFLMQLWHATMIW